MVNRTSWNHKKLADLLYFSSDSDASLDVQLAWKPLQVAIKTRSMHFEKPGTYSGKKELHVRKQKAFVEWSPKVWQNIKLK